jgi:hypothetical protein
MQGELAQPCADFAPALGAGNSKSGTGKVGSSVFFGRTITSQGEVMAHPARIELPSDRNARRASAALR